MKPWIKILIGVVSGFAGGFATGFLFHKKMNDIQFEEIDEEEMARLEEAAKSPLQTACDNASKAIDKLAKNMGVIDPQNTDEIRNAMQGKVSYVKADEEAKARFAKTWETVKEYSDEENADSLPVDPEDGLDEEFLEMIEEEGIEFVCVEPPRELKKDKKVTLDFF